MNKAKRKMITYWGIIAAEGYLCIETIRRWKPQVEAFTKSPLFRGSSDSVVKLRGSLDRVVELEINEKGKHPDTVKLAKWNDWFKNMNLGEIDSLSDAILDVKADKSLNEIMDEATGEK